MATYVCHAPGCYGLERSIVAAVGYIEAVSGLRARPEERDGFVAVISDGKPTRHNNLDWAIAQAARTKGFRIGSIRGADLEEVEEVA